MTADRIKEIQKTTAYPESVSVMIALKQVWNECEQEKEAYLKQKVSEITDEMIMNGAKQQLGFEAQVSWGEGAIYVKEKLLNSK